VGEAGSVLLLHEAGELDDVATLLRTLGIAFEQRTGPEAAALLPRDLLIATARQALGLPRLPSGPRGTAAPARLAVVEADAPGLRESLGEAGFELLLRRPVHPTALRLLLLRLLYRGPERRSRLRVAVGTAVRFRRALLWRKAILAELSSSGCRLLTARGVRTGARLLLELRGPVSPDSPLRVSGRVVRSNTLGPADPTHTLALEFLGMNQASRECLERIVAAHGRGPASLQDGGQSEAPAPSSPSTASSPPGPGEPATPGEAEACGAERRHRTRTPYATRVVTLGEEAAHVVMGRDLSLGGIRIEPHGGLERDQQVALAIHGSALAVPLVVRGRVARDDGEAGLVVLFDPLAPAQQLALEKLLGQLGGIEVLGPGGDGAESLVARVLPAAEASALA
jgi:hypothetical protein